MIKKRLKNYLIIVIVVLVSITIGCICLCCKRKSKKVEESNIHIQHKPFVIEEF